MIDWLKCHPKAFCLTQYLMVVSFAVCDMSVITMEYEEPWTAYFQMANFRNGDQKFFLDSLFRITYVPKFTCLYSWNSLVFVTCSFSTDNYYLKYLYICFPQKATETTLPVSVNGYLLCTYEKLMLSNTISSKKK